MVLCIIHKLVQKAASLRAVGHQQQSVAVVKIHHRFRSQPLSLQFQPAPHDEDAPDEVFPQQRFLQASLLLHRQQGKGARELTGKDTHALPGHGSAPNGKDLHMLQAAGG